MDSGTTTSLTVVPRAVVSLAIGMAHTVERAVGGEQRTRATERNALVAVRADRERARRREEIRLAVAALAASYRPASAGPSTSAMPPASPVRPTDDPRAVS